MPHSDMPYSNEISAAELRAAVAEYIKQHPLQALGIGGGLGFMCGGGLRTAIGRAALVLVARMTAREMLGGLLINALFDGHERRTSKSSGRSRLDRDGSAVDVAGC